MACRRRKPATRRRRPRDQPMQSASLLRRRRFSGASHDPNLKNRRQADRARSGRPHAIRLRVGRTCWNARLGAGFRLFRPPATCSTAGNAGNGKRNASPTTRITRTRWRREWRSSRDDHEVDPAVRPSPGQTSGHVNARIRGGSVEAPPPAAMRQTAAEQLLPRRARSVPPHESRLLRTPRRKRRSGHAGAFFVVPRRTHRGDAFIGCLASPAAERHGAPGRIRTPNPLIRSQVLYPVELRARERQGYSPPGRERQSRGTLAAKGPVARSRRETVQPGETRTSARRSADGGETAPRARSGVVEFSAGAGTGRIWTA